MKFGVDISQLRARKVSAADFDKYDLIVAMDHENFRGLQQIRPAGSTATLKMMMQYHPDARPDEVPDPYYGDMDGFNYMCKLLAEATQGLLKEVEGRSGQQ